MEIPTYHVDAFTLHAFSGNPAAVCLMPQAVPAGRSGDGILASIAAEFNLSETAFITPLSAGSNVFEKHDTFSLRWFTPTVEVNLCGHATLASAHVLFNHCGNTNPAITFNTLSGPLVVKRDAATAAAADGLQGGSAATATATRPVMLSMRFPMNPPTQVDWRCTCSSCAGSSLSTLNKAPQTDGAVDGVVLHVLNRIIDLALRRRSSSSSSAASLSAEAGHLDQAVHSVHYSPTTKKLIIRLADCNSQLLTQIQPDTAAMLAVDQSAVPATRRVTGVSVTVLAPRYTKQAVTGEETGGAAVAAPRAAAVAHGPHIAGGASASASIAVNHADGSAMTRASEGGIDFESRYFSPWNGIPEDPVNGSSHTILGPYWASVLGRMRPAGADPHPASSAASSTASTSSSGPVAAAGVVPCASPMWFGTVVGRQVSKRGGTIRVTVHAPALSPPDTSYDDAGSAAIGLSSSSSTAAAASVGWVDLGGTAVTVSQGLMRLPLPAAAAAGSSS